MDNKQSEQKLFFTTKELALMAKLSADYIRELIESGKIKAQKIGRDWAISATEVMRFLRERED